MSRLLSPPRWTPPMPPVAKTAMPAAAATIIVAATLLARLGGAQLPAALASGLAAAALTIASEHAVRPDLSPGLVAAAPGPVAA